MSSIILQSINLPSGPTIDRKPEKGPGADSLGAKEAAGSTFAFPMHVQVNCIDSFLIRVRVLSPISTRPRPAQQNVPNKNRKKDRGRPANGATGQPDNRAGHSRSLDTLHVSRLSFAAKNKASMDNFDKKRGDPKIDPGKILRNCAPKIPSISWDQ